MTLQIKMVISFLEGDLNPQLLNQVQNSCFPTLFLLRHLMLQGLDPTIEYEVTEPLPNNIAQQAGNFKIVEMDTSIYQLGYDSVTLSGAHLMNAGLPVKFYTLDDSVMFVLKEYTPDHENIDN